MEKNARQSTTDVGTGGMETKIKAAKDMMKSGIPMVIANGNKRFVLNEILNSEQVGTFFQPLTPKMPSRKRWLTWSVKPKGTIGVDEGAKMAIWSEQGEKPSFRPGVNKDKWDRWEKGEVIKNNR